MILLQTDYGSHVSILHVVRKNKFTNYVTDDGEPHFLHVCCLFKHVPNRLRSGEAGIGELVCVNLEFFCIKLKYLYYTKLKTHNELSCEYAKENPN